MLGQSFVNHGKRSVVSILDIHVPIVELLVVGSIS